MEISLFQLLNTAIMTRRAYKSFFESETNYLCTFFLFYFCQFCSFFCFLSFFCFPLYFHFFLFSLTDNNLHLMICHVVTEVSCFYLVPFEKLKGLPGFLIVSKSLSNQAFHSVDMESCCLLIIWEG